MVCRQHERQECQFPIGEFVVNPQLVVIEANPRVTVFRFRRFYPAFTSVSFGLLKILKERRTYAVGIYRLESMARLYIAPNCVENLVLVESQFKTRGLRG